jgi:hypothetical protein
VRDLTTSMGGLALGERSDESDLTSYGVLQRKTILGGGTAVQRSWGVEGAMSSHCKCKVRYWVELSQKPLEGHSK